jgi:hypothetical protein
MKLKTVYKVITGLFFILLIMSQANASLLSDSEKIFDWAEVEYSSSFISNDPNNSTQGTGGWYYRYYNVTGTYIGVDSEGDIYVLGGQFGNLEPLLVGTVEEYIELICADVPLPNGSVRYNVTETNQFYDSQIREHTYDYFTPSSSRYHSFITYTIGEQVVNVRNTIDQSHSIVDDHLYVSRIESNSSATTDDDPFINPNASIAANYSPAILSGPVRQYCKHQKWESPESVLTIIDNIEDSTETDNLPAQSGTVTNVVKFESGWGYVNVRIDLEEGHQMSKYSINSGILMSKSEFNSSGERMSYWEFMAWL